MSEKMLALYKSESKSKIKEVSFEQFVKELYGE
jgi:trigger factor